MLNVFIFPADGSTVETSQELYINEKQFVYTSIVVRKKKINNKLRKIRKEKILRQNKISVSLDSKANSQQSGVI